MNFLGFSFFSMQGFQNLLRFVHFLLSIFFVGILYYEHFIDKIATKESSAFWLKRSGLGAFSTGVLYFLIKSYHVGFSSKIFITPWWIFILVGSLFAVAMLYNVYFVGDSKKVSINQLNFIFSFPLIFCMMSAAHLYIEVSRDFKGWLLYPVLILLIGAIEYTAISGKFFDQLKLNKIKIITAGVGLTIFVDVIVEILAKV